jgi:hypothetical protein
MPRRDRGPGRLFCDDTGDRSAESHMAMRVSCVQIPRECDVRFYSPVTVQGFNSYAEDSARRAALIPDR